LRGYTDSMGNTELHLYGVKRLIRQLMVRADQTHNHRVIKSEDELDISHFYARDSKFAELHIGFLKQRLADMLGKEVEDLTAEDLL